MIPVVRGDRDTSGETVVVNQPKVQKPLENRRVIIKIRQNTKKPTTYVAEKIPEITLQSILKVTDGSQMFARDPAVDAPELEVEEIVGSSVPELVVAEPVVVIAKVGKARPETLKSQIVSSKLSDARIITALGVVAFLVIMGLAFGLTAFTEVTVDNTESWTQFSLVTVLEKFVEIWK